MMAFLPIGTVYLTDLLLMTHTLQYYTVDVFRCWFHSILIKAPWGLKVTLCVQFMFVTVKVLQ